MTEYTEESIFPFPRDRLWTLLRAHWENDITVSQIHPAIRSQKTLRRAPNEVVVERRINVRGKPLTSQWKFTFRAPDFLRVDILASEGPYAQGSSIEVWCSDVPEGTRLRTHVNGHISVLPFFVPQKPFMKRMLSDVDTEDEAFLKRQGSLVGSDLAAKSAGSK